MKKGNRILITQAGLIGKKQITSLTFKDSDFKESDNGLVTKKEAISENLAYLDTFNNFNVTILGHSTNRKRVLNKLSNSGLQSQAPNCVESISIIGDGLTNIGVDD